MNHIFFIALSLILPATPLHALKQQIKIEHLSERQLRVEIACKLAPEEVLFHNSLQFSTNLPQLKIVNWLALKEPETFFDTKSKKTEPVYSESVTFALTIEAEGEIPPQAMIHMYYSTNLHKETQENNFSLAPDSRPEEKGAHTLSLPVPPTARYQKTPFSERLASVTNWIIVGIQNKEIPLVFKFILTFIIGLMMSLTPCIYPMIPITMGILQSNKAHSFLRGFLLASSYTAGLSCTFAILGMMAAYGGAHFGSLMTNPWVIVPIVLFFAYLGFSMLGFYEMYIPRFMRPRQGHKNNGSLLSAFTFGIINGTVASPCLSPGLALILGIVSGLGNPILGFLLLFVFGVGSSFPLLLVGTFSSSLHILPRAGKWMIEFKKVFGFLLLGMCLYYLRFFMAEWIFFILAGLYIFGVAAYYMYYGFHYQAWVAKVASIVLCVIAAFTLTESYRALFRATVAKSTQLAWYQGSYEVLRKNAQDHNKLLLLDFTAEWCSLCKKLEKEFFAQPLIVEELPKKVLPLKVDCTSSNEENTALKAKFAILGFPTILLVNPQTETVLRRWSADLNDKDAAEILSLIESHNK